MLSQNKPWPGEAKEVERVVVSQKCACSRELLELNGLRGDLFLMALKQQNSWWGGKKMKYPGKRKTYSVETKSYCCFFPLKSISTDKATFMWKEFQMGLSGKCLKYHHKHCKTVVHCKQLPPPPILPSSHTPFSPSFTPFLSMWKMVQPLLGCVILQKPCSTCRNIEDLFGEVCRCLNSKSVRMCDLLVIHLNTRQWRGTSR